MGAWHIMEDGESMGAYDGTHAPPLLEGQTLVPIEAETGKSARDYLPVLGDDGEYLVALRPVPLAELRAQKLAAISSIFGREIAKGCASPKGRVDCDDTAQGRIGNVIQLRERAAAAGMTLPSTVTWTMLDKSQVDHDDADLVALGLAIGFGFAAKFAYKQSLEAAAEAAMTGAALDDVSIDSGWPS